MSFKHYLLIYLFSQIIINGNICEIIDCDTTVSSICGPCQLSEKCILSCYGDQKCKGSDGILKCKDNESCGIICDGGNIDGSSACEDISIDAKRANNVTMRCTQYGDCKSTNLVSGTNMLIIDCINYGSCRDMIINASLSTTVIINCYNNNINTIDSSDPICSNLEIICGTRSCIINCINNQCLDIMIDISFSSHFQCIESQNLPSSSPSQCITTKTTKSPTKVPTDKSTWTPTNGPTINPSMAPSASPTMIVVLPPTIYPAIINSMTMWSNNPTIAGTELVVKSILTKPITTGLSNGSVATNGDIDWIYIILVGISIMLCTASITSIWFKCTSRVKKKIKIKKRNCRVQIEGSSAMYGDEYLSNEGHRRLHTNTTFDIQDPDYIDDDRDNNVDRTPDRIDIDNMDIDIMDIDVVEIASDHTELDDIENKVVIKNVDDSVAEYINTAVFDHETDDLDLTVRDLKIK